MTPFLPPFLLGLAGSLHCIGMCSPLMIAVSRSGKNATTRGLFYNFGRIIVYGVLGSAFAFAGSGLVISGSQRWISISVGFMALLIGLTSVRITPPKFIHSAVYRFTNVLKNRFYVTLNRSDLASVIFLGMINGILPCGMTLVALGYCVTLGWPFDGFMAMIFFGLGTLPATVGFASIVRTIITRLKISYKVIQSSLLIIAGVLLITRGFLDFNHTGDNVASDGIVVCSSTSQ